MNNPEPRGSSFRGIFRSLKVRNFRIFILGNGVSLIGTWMQQVALSWLVYRLTGSTLLLGLVGFVGQIPTFVLSPLAGVLADRWRRYHIIVVAQSLAMIQAFALAVLTSTGTIGIWQIVVLSFLLGCINAFDIPARQSFVLELVERKENLSNAIALNSLMFNAARMAGPALAGVLLLSTSEATLFYINGLSFVAVLASLFALKLTPLQAPASKQALWANLRAGFSYAAGAASIWVTLLMLALMNLIGTSYIVLLPALAKDVLKGDSHTYGFLLTAAGTGALLATVYLASREGVTGMIRIMASSALLFSAGLGILGFSESFWPSAVILAGTGFSFMAFVAACNITLQTTTADHMRGRIMSFYTMAFMGTMPIGSLMIGALAEKVGIVTCLQLQAVCCFIIVLAFIRKVPALEKSMAITVQPSASI